MPFIEESAIATNSLSLLPSDESVVWSESDFAAALIRLEKLQEQVNSLRMALPMILFNFADLRSGPDVLYRRFEQSAITTTTTVANLKRDWSDEQTQITFRRARISAKKNPSSLLGTNRYMSLGDVFPDLDDKSGTKDKQENAVRSVVVEEIETAAEEINDIVEAYGAEHPDFIIERDLERDTIKVCLIRA